MTCRAIRQQDQMACGTCGLQWDADDASPPPCGLAAPIPDDRDPDAVLTDVRPMRNGSAYSHTSSLDDDFDFDPDDLPLSLMDYR